MSKKKVIFLTVVVLLILFRAVRVFEATRSHGSFKGEKVEILRRANFLRGKVVTLPRKLMGAMPGGIGDQFQGEWALYTCSMTSAALVNISMLYPEQQEQCIKDIEKIIEIALSSELREYDWVRWDEDPLDGIYGDVSHISYLSHLAWMISGYKQVGGGDKYDDLYRRLCEGMNSKILNSWNLTLPTYPNEWVYVPDMLVAIVALSNYSRQHDGMYASTVSTWMEKAKREWIDEKTGMLVSFLPEKEGDAQEEMPVKGSYSALNCYYLTFIDEEFAAEQYAKLKENFLQTWLVTGLQEYADRWYPLWMDIDAGPIIMNLSPSGTAFALGSATFFDDQETRKGLLKTAEIAGTTLTNEDKSHYMMSFFALVGEAIMLAMRTSVKWTS